MVIQFQVPPATLAKHQMIFLGVLGWKSPSGATPGIGAGPFNDVVKEHINRFIHGLHQEAPLAHASALP